MEDMWCDGLDYEEWSETTTEENTAYLHGLCTEWVADHCREGDKVLLIIALDGDYSVDHLVHCCLIRNGVYIDVRGVTINFDDVVEGFDDYWPEYSSEYVCEDLVSFRKEMASLGIEIQ